MGLAPVPLLAAYVHMATSGCMLAPWTKFEYIKFEPLVYGEQTYIKTLYLLAIRFERVSLSNHVYNLQSIVSQVVRRTVYQLSNSCCVPDFVANVRRRLNSHSSIFTASGLFRERGGESGSSGACTLSASSFVQSPGRGEDRPGL